jgi:uncharacterized protein (DUF2249 family)
LCPVPRQLNALGEDFGWKNIPNGHKIYQMTIGKMHQKATKYTR